MTYYRLYHIENDTFADVNPFDAPDDVAAVNYANNLARRGESELWCGARKVASMQRERESPRAALQSRLGRVA